MKKLIKGIKTLILVLSIEYGVTTDEELEYAWKDIENTKGFIERLKSLYGWIYRSLFSSERIKP